MPRRALRPLRSAALLAAVSALLLPLPGAPVMTAAAAPEPSAAKPRWQLEFEVVNDLRLILLNDRYYWFMTYKVTNRTREDLVFAPSAWLFTDAGQLSRDFNPEEVPLEVVDEIMRLIGNPLLESNTDILGVIRQGKENAREGLFVWAAQGLDINEVAIFVGGLSSESQVVRHPVTGTDIVVHKTLERRYDIPGDPWRRPQKPGELTGERWIMR